MIKKIAIILSFIITFNLMSMFLSKNGFAQDKDSVEQKTNIETISSEEGSNTLVKFNKDEIKLNQWQKDDLIIQVSGEITIDKIEWTSSDSAIVDVTSEGRVTGMAIGQAMITAEVTTGDKIYKAFAMVKVDYENSDWKSHWGADYIRKAMGNGWVSISDKFRPNDAVTRAEFVKIVNKAFEYIEIGDEPYTDVNSKDWFYEEVRIAVKAGYITTANSTFRPNDPITREEVAVIITNIMENKDSELDKINKYEDYKQVSPWAKTSVEGAIEAGYMGVGVNKFYPISNITRAEAVTSITRVNEENFMWDIEGKVVYLIDRPVDLNIYSEKKGLMNNLDNIIWEVEGTDIKGVGTDVEFTTPMESKEYNIIVSLMLDNNEYKGGKTITVLGDYPEINFDESEEGEELLGGVVREPLIPSEDYDGDGLTNEQEESLGTNPYVMDTDLDGIDDGEELNNYKTNPLKDDTDGDGILDGYEVFLGINPLDSTDSKKEFDYEVKSEENNLSVTITGTPEAIVYTEIETVSEDYLSTTAGIVGNIVDLTTIGEFSNAQLKFSYDVAEVNGKGLDENSLSVYYLNEESLELIELESTIDVDNKTVTANTNHFSCYVLADSSRINTSLGKLDVVFVLDNSGSMDDNDPENKRVQVTRELVEAIEADVRFGLVKFAGSYSVLSKLDYDKEKLYSGLGAMGASQWTGTNLTAAINGGMSLFNEDNNKKIMILLADGEDNKSSITQINNAVKNAQSKGVTIYTVGLGSELDYSMLIDIANKTSAKFLRAAEADQLKEIFKELETSITPPTINIEKIDYYDEEIAVELLEDNEFDIEKDGIPYKNFESKESSRAGGTCYGFAATAYLRFMGIMPLQGYKGEQIPYSYDLNNMDFNVDEMNVEWNFKFGIDNNYYSIRNAGEGYVLNSKGKEYWKATGMEICKEKKENSITPLPIELPKINEEVSIGNLKPHGEFTKDDINKIKALTWWWDTQFIARKHTQFTEIGIEKLIEELDAPKAITFFWEKGGHAVNVQKIYKSIEEKNTYYLKIYDNSRTDDNQYIKLSTKWGLIKRRIIADSEAWNFSNIQEIYVEDMTFIVQELKNKGYLK